VKPTDNPTQNLLALVLANIGALIVTQIAVGLFSLPAQRSFIREVLGKVRLSENIEEAGLERVVMQQNSLDWNDLFRKSKSARLFFVTNNTWRKRNYDIIADFVRSGGELTVLLPDPNNEAILTELSGKLRKDKDDCKKDIEEAILGFAEFGRLDNHSTGNPKVNIYLVTSDLYFTFYIYDEFAIVAFRSYQFYRGDVPHFVVRRGGFLYDFVISQLRVLINTRSHKFAPLC
jgi:hypothetical protein